MPQVQLIENDCCRRAEHLIGMMTKTPHMEDRRWLIDEAMRWRNCAMVARDRELDGRDVRERRDRDEVLMALPPSAERGLGAGERFLADARGS